MIRRMINANRKFGVELEYYGIKSDTTLGKVKWNHTHDGSIGFQSVRDYSAFELVSRVYDESELKTYVKDFETIKDNCTLKENQTCGFHVHFSGKETFDLQQVEAYDFPKFLVKELKEEAKNSKNADLKDFIDKTLTRMEGNRFCKLNEYQDQKSFEVFLTRSIKEKCHDLRYRAINYYALTEHGTIEFRCFPSTNKEKLVEFAVTFVFKTIKKYLRSVLNDRRKKEFQDIVVGVSLVFDEYQMNYELDELGLVNICV